MRPMTALAILCGAAAPIPRASVPPAHWPLERFVRWQPGWGMRTIVAAGVTVRVGLKHCGIDRPANEGCAEGDAYPVASVAGAGMRPVTIVGDPGVAAYVGIGRLGRDVRFPSLIIISEHGGSGGCFAVDLAVPDRTAYRHARLSIDESDHGTLCDTGSPGLTWPRDVTGHGRAEFVLGYPIGGAFTSYAGAGHVPRVIAFDGRRGVDVSGDPSLVPLYRGAMATALQACEHRVEEAAGPCAAYAADAARLHQLPRAMAVIRAQVARGCRVRAEDPCPDTDRIPARFPDELTTMFSRIGLR